MHCHVHSKQDLKGLRFVFWLNFSFALIELTGGYLSNSIAVYSDAFHDLGDSVALFIAWMLEKKSLQHADKEYYYGYRRFSVLAAVLLNLVLILSSIGIMAFAIQRIQNPQEVDVSMMFSFSLVGLSVNAYGAYHLSKSQGLNAKSAMLHLLEDVLGWAAVLLTAIVMFFADLPILDPILSVLIACFIAYNASRNFRSSLKILLQAMPGKKHLDQAVQEVLKDKRISNIHEVRAWSIDGESHVFAGHIVLVKEFSREERREIKIQIREIMKKYHFIETTIEIEELPNSDSL